MNGKTLPSRRHGPPAPARQAEIAENGARPSLSFSALGELTGGIAHDFRNVLGVIASGLRLAERNFDDPVVRNAALAAARDGIDRGLRMVDRLLALPTRPSAAAGAQDVNGLLRNLEAFLKYGAGPGNRLVLELADDLPACEVDPVQFNAAILNLVINARDALGEGGIIHIRTTAAERNMPAGGQRDFVEIQVSDNGAGMPPEVLKRVFEPYFTTKGKGGTGLGVPQVRSLMRTLGGDVEVTSSPGAGTTFSLLIPISVEPIPDGPDAWRQLDRWADEGGAIGRPVGIQGAR
jgi:signal transduction histidine kinase